LRVEAALLSGQCLLRENQPEQAVRHFQFVLHHRPESADAHRCLAEIYYTQGALMRAVEHAQQWGDLDSYDGRPWWMMGHVYKSLNNLPDAIEKYAEALHRALPADKVQEVRSELAECLVERKMWTEALQILEGADASTARELQIKCLALRVQSLWGLGRSEEARALLDQGLANHPLGVDLLRVGSEVRMADRQLEGAATLLLQALEIDRHDFTSRYRLAMAYEGLGRKADAEEQRRLAEQTKSVLAEVSKLNDAAAANPWDAASRVRLAALCEELGQREMARMWREAAKACAAGAAP
jgi:tetratricopeptide (TPR) repeat protein